MGAAQPAAPSQSSIIKTVEAGGSLLATDKPAGGDMRSKMREDPLMLIKQREAQHFKSLSANQVQMHRQREEDLEREYREALGGGKGEKEKSRDKHKHKRDHKDKRHKHGDKYSDDEERAKRKEKKRKREAQEGEEGAVESRGAAGLPSSSSATAASLSLHDSPHTPKSPKTIENTHPGGVGGSKQSALVDSDEEKRRMERQRDAMMDEGRYRPQTSQLATTGDAKKDSSIESRLHVPSSSSSSDELLPRSSDTRFESGYREEDKRSYRDGVSRYDSRDSRNDSRYDSRPDPRRSDARSDRHDYGQRSYDESSRHGTTGGGREHRDFRGETSSSSALADGGRRRDDRDFYDRPSYDTQRRGGNGGSGRGGRGGGAFDLSEEERNNAIRQMQQGAQQLSQARTALINDTRDARVREEEDHRRKATETSKDDLQPSFLSSMHHDALKSSSVEDRVSRSRFYLSKDEN